MYTILESWRLNSNKINRLTDYIDKRTGFQLHLNSLFAKFKTINILKTILYILYIKFISVTKLNRR